MSTEERLARIEATIKGNGDFRDSRCIGPDDVRWLLDELEKWREGCHVNADALRDMGRRADNNRLEVVELRAQFAAASEDSRRLEWLNSVDGADWFSHCNYGEATRAAIDLAMAQQKGGG